MKPSKMRRLYLREAALTLILIKMILRVVPLSHVFAWVNSSPRRVCRFAVTDLGWISWAVDTVAASRWINAACLPRALATYVMLRRRGLPSRLRLGVARDKENVIAHAWIEVGAENVVGDADIERFVAIADFGPSP